MRRTMTCRIAASLVAVVVACGVCACSNEGSRPAVSGAGSWDATSQPPSSTATTPSLSPATSVVPSSTAPQPSETFTPEQLEATNTLVEFVRIRDTVFSDPDADPQPLKDITTGQSQEIQLNFLRDYRENGKVQTGTTVIHITGASEPVDVDGVRTVDVQMCTDAGNIDVIETATGKSKVVPNRPRYLQWNFTMVKATDEWKVGDATDEIVGRCPA